MLLVAGQVSSRIPRIISIAFHMSFKRTDPYQAIAADNGQVRASALYQGFMECLVEWRLHDFSFLPTVV
jgi:hypothetical protein